VTHLGTMRGRDGSAFAWCVSPPVPIPPADVWARRYDDVTCDACLAMLAAQEPVLSTARALIKHPSQWTTGHLVAAVDVSGAPCGAREACAVAWSGWGAVLAVVGSITPEGDALPAIRMLDAACPRVGAFSYWHESATHQQVLEVFDRALTEAERVAARRERAA